MSNYNYVPKRNNIFDYLLNIPAKQLTRLIIKTSLTPNQITLFGGLLALIGILIFDKNRLFSTIFIILYMIIDLVDGDIARTKKQFSKLGWWGDKMIDKFVESGLLISFYISFQGENRNQLLVIFLLAYVYLSQFSMEAINQIVRGNKEVKKSFKKIKGKKEIKIYKIAKNIANLFLCQFTLEHTSLLFLLSFGTLILSDQIILILLSVMSLYSFISIAICHYLITVKYDNL